MRIYYRDPALWIFGLLIVACLFVSTPATLIGMQLFHGAAIGAVAMLVFEAGAVASELMTLVIPQWRKRLLALTMALLVATTFFNYALGADEFVKAALKPATYEAINAAGAGWLMVVIASALFPALLLVFMTAFTARARALRAHTATERGILAFWVGSVVRWNQTQLREREQALAASEQAKTLLAQQAADLRQTVAAREQVLVAVEQQVIDREQALAQSAILSEQARAHFDQLVADYGQQMTAERGRRQVLEQELAASAQQAAQARREREQVVAAAQRTIAELRQELDSRPVPVEIEVIKIARYQLTWDQFATIAKLPVSTLRRRVPELIAAPEQGE